MYLAVQAVSNKQWTRSQNSGYLSEVGQWRVLLLPTFLDAMGHYSQNILWSPSFVYDVKPGGKGKGCGGYLKGLYVAHDVVPPVHSGGSGGVVLLAAGIQVHRQGVDKVAKVGFPQEAEALPIVVSTPRADALQDVATLAISATWQNQSGCDHLAGIQAACLARNL